MNSSRFIFINFENMGSTHLCNTTVFHDEINRRDSEIKGKVYRFLDEIQEAEAWERCINSLRMELDCVKIFQTIKKCLMVLPLSRRTFWGF